MVRSFSCFNSSATAGLGGGSTAASLPTASSSRRTSNQSNKFDITGKQHNGLPRRLLEARRLRGGWDVSRGHLGAVLGEIAQRVYHRVAGNSDNAGKWVVELQYYEDGARVRKGAAGVRGFRSVKHQHTVEQGDFRCHLHHFTSRGVERTLGRTDE